MKDFKEIKPDQVKDNPFQLIGSDWMLVTAGNLKSFNMMTASWGGMGELWDRDVCFVFIRPTRYTFQLMEKSERFTLSVFEEKFRDVLTFCGSRSGKTVNKAKETGVTPVETPSGAVYFAEARLVFECRKIYFQDIQPQHFLDPAIDHLYASKDYHRMYIGEIEKVLAKPV